MILQKLKQAAEESPRRKITDAVNHGAGLLQRCGQRQATRRRAIAGLKRPRIINEPTAAALAYGPRQAKDETHRGLHDSARTSTSRARSAGDCRSQATTADTHLGGDDLNVASIDGWPRVCKKSKAFDLSKDRIGRLQV